MTRARCGKVDSLSGFALPDGTVTIKIDGVTYSTIIDAVRLPVAVGDLIEYRTEGKRAEITAVQVPLLSEPQAENLFNNCTACIGCAGSCSCKVAQ